jgi:hypothetical protein
VSYGISPPTLMGIIYEYSSDLDLPGGSCIRIPGIDFNAVINVRVILAGILLLD